MAGILVAVMYHLQISSIVNSSQIILIKLSIFVVQQLLDRGVSADLQNQDGLSALHQVRWNLRIYII